MNTIDIRHGDAFKLLSKIPDNSIHFVLTDPPYFIDGMGSDWDDGVLQKRASRAGVIGSMPTGMKFSPDQGRQFQKFMAPISEEIYRVLKPGGFAVVFSQARLYGRLAVAIEDAGFEIRDMLGWTYEGQAKAFSQDHFVKRMHHLSNTERNHILKRLDGRKTPQLKP